VLEPEAQDDALALLCDGCDGEFLLDEVGLTDIPEGDWFCDKCDAAMKRKTRKPATAPKSKKRASASKEDDQPPKRRSTRRT